LPRKYAVKVDGKERIVDIDEGAFRVDGTAVDLELLEAETGLYLLRQGNEQVVAQVDGTGAKTTVALRRPGKDVVVVAAEVGEVRRVAAVAARGAQSAGPVTIRSPIPGRVVKVLVKAGDPVAAGATAVVLEAMKMENELKAPRAGTVTAVLCAEGTAVEAGQDLITVS
jgi:biotin carboxyl carrier protein